MNQIISEFAKTKPTPSPKLLEHLNLLAEEFKKEQILILR